ncbi:DUF475 domain-containing protein [Patescibacteria group bacterium]|nr:MAG: DUF475 domain-containing protein [Patescibacteria group bacterium]
MLSIVKFFGASVLVTLGALGAVYYYLGIQAFLTAALLVILEVTLSFDNAVVNARVLEKMSPKWQKRFLTWGILIAVFGTRIFLPIFIVSAVVWASPLFIAHIAFFDPAHYGELLEGAAAGIHAFGATFLLLVALKYFLDENKKTHWIQFIERHLISWGRIEAIEITLALLAVAGVSYFVPAAEQATVLIAGIAGILVFIGMQALTSAFTVETKTTVNASFALFMYLEVLDTAFSLDGVIGAFALTSAIPVIAVGLGVGAYFVRSLTIYMVKQKTLDTLVYLEHGAHWAIFGLAASMLVSLLTDVPEVVTGTVGLVFVVAAYYSSLRFNKNNSSHSLPA